MTKISADKHSIKKGDSVNVSWSSDLPMLMSRGKIGEMILYFIFSVIIPILIIRSLARYAGQYRHLYENQGSSDWRRDYNYRDRMPRRKPRWNSARSTKHTKA